MSKKQKIAVNKGIVNKIDRQDREQKRILTQEFENMELTPTELAAFINAGHPFCAQHQGSRKGEHFICSDVLAVDIDHGLTLDDAMQDEYVQQYASIVYATPSHTPDKHRFRFVFQLERTVTDPLEMRHAYVGAIRKFGGDGSCRDACRLFYGSKGSNPIVLGNILPSAELDHLIAMGQDVRVSDSSGDPEDKTSNVPTGNRSRVSLKKNLTVRLAKGGRAELDRLNARTPIHCVVHKPDLNASAMVVVNEHGKRGVYCSRCACTFWHDEVRQNQQPPYDFNRVADAVRQLAHEEFPHHHDDLYNIDDDGNLIEPTPDDIADWQRQLAGRSHVHLFKKFLPEMSLEPGVTFVRSPKNTGKTTQLKKISAQCKSQGLSVLLIGHRQTLLRSMSNDLNLVPYLYEEGGTQKNNSPADRYAICVDSMHKLLKPHLHYYDVVIVDEAEQVFSHIASASTLKEKRIHCYELLCLYLADAKSVILCDADLGSISVAAITQIVDGDTPYRFYLNDYRPEAKQYDLYADENHLSADMITAIGNGGRHYVATNSKRKAQRLCTAITRTHPEKKIMLVTADGVNDPATQHFIDNIRTEILNYDVVIASPTLGTGIDITFENAAQEIDTVFGSFVSRVNTHFDMDQQLSRVRNPKAMKVWVTPERFNFETDPQAIEAEMILCRNLNDLIRGWTRERLPILDQQLLKVYTQVVGMQRASKNALRRNFVQLREQNGWRANLIERSVSESKSGATLLKEAKAVVDANYSDSICSAQPITEEDYRTLIGIQKTKPLSHADQYSMRHYELSSFYHCPVDPALIKLDKNGDFRECIRLAEVYFAPLSATVERSRRFDDDSALSTDANNLPLKRELLRELLASAGLADDNHAIRCDIGFTQASLKNFEAAWRDHAGEIETLFKLPMRSDLNTKAVNSLTAILDLIGLKKKMSANYKVGKKDRVREYQVDSESLELVENIMQRRAVCAK